MATKTHIDADEFCGDMAALLAAGDAVRKDLANNMDPEAYRKSGFDAVMGEIGKLSISASERGRHIISFSNLELMEIGRDNVHRLMFNRIMKDCGVEIPDNSFYAYIKEIETISAASKRLRCIIESA
jgi:hypothetical protein